MTRPRPRCIAAGVALALICAGGMLGWTTRDPWPALGTILCPDDHRVIGITAESRSVLIQNRESGIMAWNLATGQPQQPQPDPIIQYPIFARDRRSYLGVIQRGIEPAQLVLVDAASAAIRTQLHYGPGTLIHQGFGPGDQTVRAFVRDAAPPWNVIAVTWDLATGTKARQLVSGWGIFVGPMSYAPDGRLIVFSDPTRTGYLLWDVDADKTIGSILPVPGSAMDPNVGGMFTPDGRTLVIGQRGSGVEVWDVATLRLIRTIPLPGGPRELLAIDLSPDGSILILNTEHPESPLAQIRERLPAILGGAVSWSQQDLTLLDFATGRVLARAENSYQAWFAPDGQSVVTSGYDRLLSIRPTPRAVKLGE